MCTVTYLPLNKQGGFILTSNRDERINRPALPPSKYTINGKELIFPKDLEKEGTWICLHTSWALCLLNGAFVKHSHQPPYRISRGLVVLDFYNYCSPTLFAQQYDFNGIEPFTLLMLGIEQKDRFFELKWDGSAVHLNNLDASRPHIRSSATLYSPEVVHMREQWFEFWLKENHHYSQEGILDFHHFKSSGERSHDLLMKKNELLQTVSITSIYKNGQRLRLHYEDLLKAEIETASLIV